MTFLGGFTLPPIAADTLSMIASMDPLGRQHGVGPE